MSATLVSDCSVFLRAWIDCLLLFHFLLYLLLFSLFLLQRSLSFAGKMRQEGSSPSYAAGRRLGGFLHHHEILLDSLWSFLHSSARRSSSGRFFRSWRFDFLLAQNFELLQNNSCLLGCKRFVETCAEFRFSWVYTFSAMLSFLRNWANHDRYRLRPSTPAQLCWSSSRLQPLQKTNLIKFAIIRPSALNHDRNVWNCRGAHDETTC